MKIQKNSQNWTITLTKVVPNGTISVTQEWPRTPTVDEVAQVQADLETFAKKMSA